jgi:hypothetical protein
MCRKGRFCYIYILFIFNLNGFFTACPDRKTVSGSELPVSFYLSQQISGVHAVSGQAPFSLYLPRGTVDVSRCRAFFPFFLQCAAAAPDSCFFAYQRLPA